MHENKERLTRIGNAILSASRNELYLSMRFFDLALSGLGYQMNLNTATIATDGVNILYNPTYLQRQYVDDMIQLNPPTCTWCSTASSATPSTGATETLPCGTWPATLRWSPFWTPWT